MNEPNSDTSLTTLNFEVSNDYLPSDPNANPFKLVVDPVMRTRLRRALFDLIENHDQELARYVSEGSLALESYKEYIELFARSLKQTINLYPETRWKVQR
jgi:hypothetical protein